MYILRKSTNKESSRLQININGVQDEVLILPNNEYRAILNTGSINFELKSEAEQDVLVENYKSFLNSLPCPVQILFRVREMDMDKYLGAFHARLIAEKEKIYKEQIKNYSEFVKQLVVTSKILSRNFYIVIPFSSDDNLDFRVAQELNCDIISKGLGRLGIQTRRLPNLEILDLFYSFYNPEQSKRQSITDQTLQLLKKAYI
jgi:hypothetical protein